MNPVRTEQTRDMASHPSPEILDLPIEIRYIEHSTGTTPSFSSYWQPEPAEIEALMGGGGVKVTSIGILPPMKVEVVSFVEPGVPAAEGSERMSYSVSLSGHGVDAEKAKAAFETFVGELRDATSEGGSGPSGSISGSENGTPFTLQASDVAASGDADAGDQEGTDGG